MVYTLTRKVLELTLEYLFWKDLLTSQGQEVGILGTGGTFPHFIALMILSCYRLLIVFPQSVGLTVSSYITVYREHPGSSAACPILIFFLAIHYCCVYFSLKEQISFHHLGDAGSQLENMHFFNEESIFWHRYCLLLLWQPCPLCCTVLFHTLG